ncbi:hypothetical protein [Jongsikchunia kroppenstedtii]|uniref:hypothetical protein n=1 Tax=Jongsikchunia kroppenstedtii TaxID=1121721 RepID=UPI0003760450|nr:hypothetical protein [Jongsikchunia kroppenstedtii]
MTGLAIRWLRRPLRGAALAAAGIAIATTITACGGSDSGSANLSELPPTNELSTEQPTPPTTTTRDQSTTTSRTDSGGGPTILESIRSASDVDSSQYHSGATGPDATMQTTAQFHFATPSLDASCSSVNADTPTLICVGNSDDAGARSPGGTGCPVGAGHIVVLTTSGAQQGECTDAAKVLTRSQILPYGNSLSFGDFICAAEVSGLFCLNNTANSGFEMSDGSYRSVQGSQQMPDADVPESTGGN